MVATSITRLSQQLNDNPQIKQLPSNENKDSIKLVKINDSKVYIYSQNYSGFNLYKMLNYAKPELVIVQHRPDDFINSEVTQQSYTKALESIKKPAHEAISDYNSYKSLLPLLKRRGLYFGSGRIEKIPEKSFQYFDRIHGVTSLVAGTWCIQHNIKDIVFGDMPRHYITRRLLSSCTLMQYQQMYENIMKTIGASPDIFPRGENEFPIKIAYNYYPHIWAESSNTYIAALIRKYSKDYKRIFCVLARGHSQVIDLCQTNDITFDRNIPIRHESVVRADSSEMVIEKLALIDTFFFGDQLIKDLMTHTCRIRLENIIDELTKEDRAAGGHVMSVDQIKSHKSYLLKLYVDFLKKYSDHGNTKILEGKKLLRNEFLKQTISIL